MYALKQKSTQTFWFIVRASAKNCSDSSAVWNLPLYNKYVHIMTPVRPCREEEWEIQEGKVGEVEQREGRKKAVKEDKGHKLYWIIWGPVFAVNLLCYYLADYMWDVYTAHSLFLMCHGQQPHSLGFVQTTPPYPSRKALLAQREEHCVPQRGIRQLWGKVSNMMITVVQ